MQLTFFYLCANKLNFCNFEIDSIEYIFWNFQQTQIFWNEFAVYVIHVKHVLLENT